MCWIYRDSFLFSAKHLSVRS